MYSHNEVVTNNLLIKKWFIQWVIKTYKQQNRLLFMSESLNHSLKQIMSES